MFTTNFNNEDGDSVPTPAEVDFIVGLDLEIISEPDPEKEEENVPATDNSQN